MYYLFHSRTELLIFRDPAVSVVQMRGKHAAAAWLQPASGLQETTPERARRPLSEGGGLCGNQEAWE